MRTTGINGKKAHILRFFCRSNDRRFIALLHPWEIPKLADYDEVKDTYLGMYLHRKDRISFYNPTDSG
jgi:hypothetical protein